MAQTLAHALLPLLVISMATRAAPVAEQPSGSSTKEMAVAAVGDRNTLLDLDKRAKEKIVYGNQQNIVKSGAAVKKSEELPQDPVPSQENSAQADQQPQTIPNEQDHVEEEPQKTVDEAVAGASGESEELASKQSSQADEVGREKESSEEPQQGSGGAASSAVEAQEGSSQGEAATGDVLTEEQLSSGGDQEPPKQADEANEAKESQDVSQASPADQQGSGPAEENTEEEDEEEEPPVPVEGGEHTDESEDKEEKEEAQNNEVPQMPSVEEGGVHPNSGEDNGNVDAPKASESAPEEEKPSEEENHLPDSGSSNQNSEDPEQALQALDQPQNSEDDVDSLLNDLQEPNSLAVETSENGGDAERRTEDNLKNDEGSAERELMEVSNHIADGNVGNENNVLSSSFLKYLMEHTDGYGRVPPTTNYMYPSATDPYYLQRRRRSSLPHIHRRQKNLNNNNNNHPLSEKALSRAKRTKRDLFDDNLYYNADLYNPQEEEEKEEEEEEREKNAELQELLTYLMALYPAIYDNERPNIPGYLWQGPNYPENVQAEEEEEEAPYWEEAYEEPQVGWGEPELETPAWEPSFYPEEEEEGVEEEEEPEFYPALRKRQMMSFVPGQRRKRYFFPFAREPYTHWGAFVPSQEKREYYGEEERELGEDPYKRLKELAMVLAEDRQPGYFDALDAYKKK